MVFEAEASGGGSKAGGLPHPPLPLSIPPKFSDKPVGGKVRSSEGEVPRLPPTNTTLICTGIDNRDKYGGLVAKWLGSRSCDQQVAGSNPGRRAAECNPGQVVNTHVPLSPSSIIWYRPMGGDARGGWGR